SAVRAVLVLALAALAGSALSTAATRYAVKGMIVSVDRAASTLTASIDAIPNYMPAMTTPFAVRQASDLEGLVPGTIVEFSLVVDDRTSYAENIHVVRYESVEQDPFTASRLALLGDIVRGTATRSLAAGDTVPDFTLTDQKRRQVRLADFRGKVIAVNFI